MSFGEFLRTRLFEPLGMTRHRLLVSAGEAATASRPATSRTRAAG